MTILFAPPAPCFRRRSAALCLTAEILIPLTARPHLHPLPLRAHAYAYAGAYARGIIGENRSGAEGWNGGQMMGWRHVQPVGQRAHPDLHRAAEHLRQPADHHAHRDRDVRVVLAMDHRQCGRCSDGGEYRTLN